MGKMEYHKAQPDREQGFGDKPEELIHQLGINPVHARNTIAQVHLGKLFRKLNSARALSSGSSSVDRCFANRQS